MPGSDETRAEGDITRDPRLDKLISAIEGTARLSHLVDVPPEHRLFPIHSEETRTNLTNHNRPSGWPTPQGWEDPGGSPVSR